MHRRRIVTLAVASSLAASAVTGAMPAQSGDENGEEQSVDLDAALRRFRALPGTPSYLVHVGQGGSLGRFGNMPNLVLFTASAYKTFVLGQYLRDAEAGRLPEDEPIAIDDVVRDTGSPVFLDLAGRTPARSVLEAMIAHSDNTATTAATVNVGADRVRALIARAGLRGIRIPDTTRIFSSYIVGAPPGVDLGWPGIVQAYQNPPGPLRPLLNDVITLAGTARDFVSWYEQALQGAFFTKPETLIEFKRIQAMSKQIVLAVPNNTVAFAKGGEVGDFEGFNAKSFAGQILVDGDKGRTPVTFCFLVNWEGPGSDFPAVEAEYFAAIRSVLGAVKRALR